MTVLGVCRTRYYVQPTRLRTRDGAAIAELQAVHDDNPYYGVERLAIALGWSEAKARRIRNLAGIHIPRPSKKRCQVPETVITLSLTSAELCCSNRAA